MALYWVAKVNDAGETRYFIQEATTQLNASLRSALAAERNGVRPQTPGSGCGR